MGFLGASPGGRLVENGCPRADPPSREQERGREPFVDALSAFRTRGGGNPGFDSGLLTRSHALLYFRATGFSRGVAWWSPGRRRSFSLSIWIDEQRAGRVRGLRRWSRSVPRSGPLPGGGRRKSAIRRPPGRSALHFRCRGAARATPTLTLARAKFPLETSPGQSQGGGKAERRPPRCI